MSKEKQDILFEIDMQLYDEFNDEIATMNDHLGDIYSLRDVEEVEEARKEKEIELLRIAVTRLQNKIKKAVDFINDENNYISKDKIKEKIKELEKEYEEYKDSQEWEIFDETKYAYELLQELLEERN